MLFNFLGLTIVLGVIYFLFRQIYINSNFKLYACSHCEGKGFWLGTRGDKNTCKICDGTGKNQSYK